MQLIYGDKTTKSLARFKFPNDFLLSVNKTHYSNEKEACKQFRNWFEKNINLSKLKRTTPSGQIMWFRLVVLNLSFYRFEKKKNN